MLYIVRRLRAHQRGAANQSGFALATTLAILLMTSILVAALLGLTFSTVAFSGDQVRRDSETRAAEAGVQSAISSIASDEPEDANDTLLGHLPTAGLDLADLDACNSPEGPDKEPLLVDTFEGHPISVYCTSLQTDTGFVPENDDLSTMEVLGEAPGDWWRQVDASGAGNCQPLSQCLPWGEALDRAQQVSGSTVNRTQFRNQLAGAGVVHAGTDSLSIVGDARVTNGTAALRNAERDCGNASCPYVPEPPGVVASGAYSQGDPGPLASGGNRCGVLSPPADGATVVSGDLRLPAAQINTLGGLGCDIDTLRNDTADAFEVTGSVPAAWASTELIRAADRRTTPPFNGATGNSRVATWQTSSCPVSVGGVLRFEPGAYPADLTLRINQWLNACRLVKFWFTPGEYWIDGNSGAGTSELVFPSNNSGNVAVFGTPVASVPIQSMTAANAQCDPARPGVRLTLTARTSIRHEAGAVSLCGLDGGRSAIWQEANPNLGWVDGAPTAASGAGVTPTGGIFATLASWFGFAATLPIIGTFFGGSLNSVASYLSGLASSQVDTTFPLDLRRTCDLLTPNRCYGSALFSTTWAPASAADDPGPARISEASLLITADETNANSPATRAAPYRAVSWLCGNIFDIFGICDDETYADWLPRTEVAVFVQNANGTYPAQPTCRVTSNRVNDSEGRSGPHTISVELLEPGSQCVGRITDRSQLIRSRIDVAMQAYPGTCVFCTYGMVINNVQLQTARSLDVLAGNARTCTSPDPGRKATCGRPGAFNDNNAEGTTALGGTGTTMNMAKHISQRNCGPAPDWWRVDQWIRYAACQLLRNTYDLIVGKQLDNATSVFTLPNLTDRYNPDLSRDLTGVAAPVTSLNLKMRGVSSCRAFYGAVNCEHYNAANAVDSSVTVTVRSSPGGSAICSATFPRLPEWNQVRVYDLLAPDAANPSNTCDTALRSNGVVRSNALEGRTLDVAVRAVRNKEAWGGCYIVADISGIFENLEALGCEYWRYQVDYIGVSSTLDTSTNAAFDGPVQPWTLTSNTYPEASRPNNSARFNVYGNVTAPRADWLVRWWGPPTGDPVVTGPPAEVEGEVPTAMTIGSLQSVMAARDGQAGRPSDDVNTLADDPRAGIVCCARGKPAERLVELRAYVDPSNGAIAEGSGELRATALVRVRDLVPADAAQDEVTAAQFDRRGKWWPGFDVVIEEYRLCNRRAGATSCLV